MKRFKFTFSEKSKLDYSYVSFFGKEVSHEIALTKIIKDGLIHILMEVNGVGEKDFSKIDGIKDSVVLSENLIEFVTDLLKSGKRLNLAIELLYDSIYNK